jgi:sigma-B regulation protein RsbU (phosphoserine phosphatase)
MLLCADGEVRRAGYPGRAVGVFEEPKLIDQETRLNPGDALVLFTDGVTEARSPGGGFFGEERLAALLRSSTGLDAASLAACIESAVLEFREDGESDDIAILVLRMPAQPVS